MTRACFENLRRLSRRATSLTDEWVARSAVVPAGAPLEGDADDHAELRVRGHDARRRWEGVRAFCGGPGALDAALASV